MAEAVSQTAEELRAWLRSLKEASGSSFADIAQGIGEDSRNVKRWMALDAKPSIPGGDSLLRLLDYFGVKLIPPAPRTVALSLMGEIRDLQTAIRRLESGEGGEKRVSLPQIDNRLEELAGSVAEVVRSLKPSETPQAPAAGARKRGKARRPARSACAPRPLSISRFGEPTPISCSFATAGKVRKHMERTTVMSKKRLRRALILVAAFALVFAASASAASPNVAWTTRDVKTAVRGLGYPKPHPKKLACKGQGAATNGRFVSFRCVARYAHHRRRVFYVEGRGLGGWLCAGTTLADCKVLKRGFVTSGQVAFDGSVAGAAQLATRGYVENRYATFDTFPAGACSQTGSSSWACGYNVTGGTIMVTVTLKAARGGYVVTATAQTQ